MLNPPSLDIDTLEAEVLWDISGNLPSIVITNKSTGSGLANVSWWFVADTPSGSPIHHGSDVVPDKNGIWTTHTLSDPWPRPMNNIEFSAAPYTLKMYAKDGAGNIYSVDYSVSICRPHGNLETSTKPYGLANTELEVKCNMGRVFFRNSTNVSYQGLTGTMNASILRMYYPVDDTLTQPAPFVANNFSTALVPISYSGDNYQFIAQQFYTYDFGNGAKVKIQYRQSATFPVYCNMNLYPLICEIQNLVNDIETGNCSDVVSANEKLMLINSKFSLVMTGIIQPLTGVNVPELIKQIEAIGEFKCDCCSAPTGIIPDSSSIIDGYNFVVHNNGGDVIGGFVKNGANIELNLQDKSYVFAIGASTLSQTTAFSVSNSLSGDGFTKTYFLNVNLSTFATDLANTIAANGTLVNLWKTVLGIDGNVSVIVDGGVLFQSNSTCNYTFTLHNIPANTTYASFSSITVDGVAVSKNYAFNLTNLPGLQTYLNGMGLGTWTVTDEGGGDVKFTTSANPNNISGITYSVSTTTYIADMTRTCTGYTPVSLNEFAAYVVNYITNLSDSNIKTSSQYEVCYIDNNGIKQTEIFQAGVSLNDVLASITQKGCLTVDYIKSLNAVDCNSMKSIFKSNPDLSITGQDYAMGTKGAGICSRIPYLDIFKYGINAAKSDAETLNLLCEAVTACGAGLPCAPFDYFEIIVTDYDTNCVQATGIEYTLS